MAWQTHVYPKKVNHKILIHLHYIGLVTQGPVSYFIFKFKGPGSVYCHNIHT